MFAFLVTDNSAQITIILGPKEALRNAMRAKFDELLSSLGTLSSGNADGDGNAETVRRLRRERRCSGNSQTLSSTVGNRGFRTVKLIDIIDIRPLFIRMN